jgi:hypothetical protein
MSDAAKCSHIPNCSLYPRFSLKGALKIWQERYCNHPTQHQRCVRFIRANAGEPVPPTLLPNGEEIPT